jgi:hypothetical protein
VAARNALPSEFPIVWYPAAWLLPDFQIALEIRCMVQSSIETEGRMKPALPSLPIQCPDYQVRVADNLWLPSGERMNKFTLKLVLVCNNQFAARTVPARLSNYRQTSTFHMDKQRKLPEIRQLLAFWASIETSVRIWIKSERIFRRQASDSSGLHSSATPFYSGTLFASPVQ